MKVRFDVACAVVVVSLFGAGCSGGEAPAPGALGVTRAALTAEPFEMSAGLQAQIDAAQAACNCFSSVRPMWVIPAVNAQEAFSSDELLELLVEQDVQLPWAAAGEINPGALNNLLGSQSGLIDAIAAEADSSGGGWKLGAHKWSYMTAPDYCSGETLYLMYFEQTGVVFAFRFDSSSEC